jgi:predicted DNA-binding transcriptional regulator YafY
MSETSSRLLELLSLLQGRRDWPGSELADRLEVSGRTIRRDIERLRRLGYPVESLTGPAGGYRLRAGSAMPPLLLDDEEAIAIAVGLRTAAGASVTGIEETAVRALVKLEQVLPAHLRRRVGALGAATFTLPVGGPTIDPAHLTVIAGACRDSECLRFGYRSRDGIDSRREVEPHSLVTHGRRWYLVAWDRRRDDWRTFRLDRVGKAASTGVRFTPRSLPAKDAAAYVKQSITGAPNRFEARVTLHAAAEEITDRVPAYWGAIEPIDARTCEYRTGDDNLGWLALRIAMLGVDFEVHEPPELVEHLRALSSRLRRAARRAGGSRRVNDAE